MSSGWKQVWEDLRRSAGGRPTVPGEEPSAAPTPPADGAEAEAESATLPASPAVATGSAATAPASEPAPAGARLRRGRVGWILATSVVLTALAFFVLADRGTPEPPSPDVVATFEGGRITVEDVRQHLAFLVRDEELRRQVRSPEDYRHLVYEMIGDELVRRWAATREPDREEDFRHVMKHLTEEMDLGKLAGRLHEGSLGVTEADVQAYYDANRAQFGEQTLTAVRDRVRAQLQAEREGQFEREYLDGLKERATVRRELTLLDVPEPTERELEDEYRASAERYALPARAWVDELVIPAGEDPAAARDRAAQALARLRSGAEWAAVASELAAGPPEPTDRPETVVAKGTREPAYEEVVFSLDPGQVSPVIEAGDAFYVVRLRRLEPGRVQELDEVRGAVRAAVLARAEEAWFRDNADRTLLTIDERRFTVGQFWEEYRELPPGFRARFQGSEGRRQLAERLIERWVLLQDSRREPATAEDRAEAEHARLEVLGQMMEQEEVDDKLAVTGEEVRAFFDENRARLVRPPRSRVRYLVLRLGETEDDAARAREKADEAYRKLVPRLFGTGEDFVAVAQQYSEDPVRAQQPVWVGEGPDVLAEITQHGLHEYIEGIPVGKIGEPFEWGRAMYLFEVLEREEPMPIPFEEAEALIREELLARKHQELRLRLNEGLMEKAGVKVYESTLQALAAEAAAGLAARP